MDIRPTGSTSAAIMVIQDVPGEAELRNHSPLEGSAGMEFNRMLSDAGLTRADCFITSLIKNRIRGNVFESQIAMTKKEITPFHVPFYDRFVLPAVLDGLRQLEKEIDLVRPKVILALGNGTLFPLTSKWGIKSWRGSELDYTSPGGHKCKIIPTYSPGYILSVWKDRSISVSDLRRTRNTAYGGPTPELNYNFILRPSFSKVIDTIKTLQTQVEAGPTKLSVDIETRAGHLACTGVAWSKTDAICIPHMCIERASGYWLEEEEAFIAHRLYKLLTHPNAVIIGQNFLYDAQYFIRWFHFWPNLVRDTMIAEHSMYSNMPKGLDYLSSKYTATHVYWKDESKNWDPKIGEDQLWAYNCKDCVITYEVDEVQQSAIDKLGLREVSNFQQDLYHAVLDTMVRGICIDHEAKESFSRQIELAIISRQQQLREIIGRDINIKSPKQMCDFFYREMDQKPIKSRKTGSVTCDDSALERIGQREPLLLPITKLIAELRSLGVFLATFLEAPVDTDRRMRCSFNIAGTETYRFSSSKNAFGSGLNLQNIPSGDEDAADAYLPNVRKIFVPDNNMEFFDIDLDSSDLRVVVWESDASEMKAMFREGLKPYVEIAKEYYRDPTITKHHPSYKLFKALAHGTNYLGTASGLAGRIGLTVSDTDRIQKWYYGKFPQIQKWQDDIKAQVRGRKYVQNIFGYRWNVLDRIEGTIDNQAVAWIGQSTTACVINRGYCALHRNEPRIEVLLQVHDSLGGQYPIAIREEAKEKIRHHCAIRLPYEDPLIIPIGVKTSTLSWGDCS